MVFLENGTNPLNYNAMNSSISELFAISITQEQADYLLKLADKNGDGVIDYTEFVQLHNFTATLLH